MLDIDYPYCLSQSRGRALFPHALYDGSEHWHHNQFKGFCSIAIDIVTNTIPEPSSVYSHMHLPALFNMFKPYLINQRWR